MSLYFPQIWFYFTVHYRIHYIFCPHSKFKTLEWHLICKEIKFIWNDHLCFPSILKNYLFVYLFVYSPRNSQTFGKQTLGLSYSVGSRFTWGCCSLCSAITFIQPPLSLMTSLGFTVVIVSVTLFSLFFLVSNSRLILVQQFVIPHPFLFPFSESWST